MKYVVFSRIRKHSLRQRRHDNQHNDIQHHDTQHKLFPTVSKTILCHYAECHYAECRVLFIVMLNVIVLSVVMLNVVVPKQLLSSLGSTYWRGDSVQLTSLRQLVLQKRKGNLNSQRRVFFKVLIGYLQKKLFTFYDQNLGLDALL